MQLLASCRINSSDFLTEKILCLLLNSCVSHLEILQVGEPIADNIGRTVLKGL